MPVEKSTQSTKSFDRGYSQTRAELMKKMLDSTVSIKSDNEKPDLAELTEIDFTWERAFQTANILIFVHTGEYLTDLETVVLYGAWNYYSYRKIAEIINYTDGYLCRDIGQKLWRKLSLALGVEPLITKSNFRAFLKREWQKYTQTISDSKNIALFKGLLALNSTFYLERPPIEKNCYETIRQPGSLIIIEGAKWMGKTFLVKQILEQENLNGRRTVYLDFSNVDQKTVRDINALFRWLYLMISLQLNLDQRSVLDWNDNCTIYFEKYILNETESDIILALDNIDYLFSNKKTTEKFLKLLSHWHEKGQVKGHWSRLKLILTQSMNANISTNFDISLLEMGTPIVLEKFSFNQVKTLANFYKVDWDEFTLYRLFKEVEGNPYLVRLAMYQNRIENSLETLNSLSMSVITLAGKPFSSC